MQWMLIVRNIRMGFPEFVADNGLSEKPVIALLAGSRKQEIKDNLPMMLEAAAPFTKDYQLVLAGAPGWTLPIMRVI